MRLFFASIGLILLAAGTSASAETIRFAITRNGQQIGTHTMEITRAGPETDVNIASDLAVKVLFVTAYRRQQNVSERWLNGHLVAFNSTTDDNGTVHKVAIVPKATNLEVDADGKTTHIDRDIVPASLWNSELLRRNLMLDIQDGEVLPLTVIDGGSDQLTINSHNVRAHHYTLKSKYSQEVWYDDQQHLVQVKIIGSDGSVIMFKLI
jgi:hypothetical protein